MISVEKWSILTPLQKLPKNVRYLGKLIAAKGFKKLPKVQKIAQSGHTDQDICLEEHQNIPTDLPYDSFCHIFSLDLVHCSIHLFTKKSIETELGVAPKNRVFRYLWSHVIKVFHGS